MDASVDLAWERGDEPERLSPELESTVYRLVQESLTNAIRHGGPTRIGIEIGEQDGCVEVAVSDDGSGFDTAASGGGGFGLTGMQERVDLADGELDIESGPSGTTVRARLPVRRSAPAGA